MKTHIEQQAKIDFIGLVGKYRQMLMGLMILWIIFLHMRIAFPPTFLGQGLRFFQGCGILAVDIFFLLSGFGLCFSKSGSHFSQFIKKRIFRILPAYWMVLGTETILLVILGDGKTIGCVLRLFLGIEFPYSGNLDYWFISAIIMCYVLFPFFRQILGNNQTLRNAAIMIGICLTVAILISYTGVCRYLLVFVLRIPSFILGIVLGRIVLEKRQLSFSPWNIGIVVLLFILGLSFYGAVGKWASPYLKWNWGLYWYPGIIASLPSCFLLAKLCDVVAKTGKAFCGFIGVLGGCTLEIYLSNCLLADLMRINPVHKDILHVFRSSTLTVEIVIALMSLLLGVGLAYVIHGVRRVFSIQPMQHANYR